MLESIDDLLLALPLVFALCASSAGGLHIDRQVFGVDGPSVGVERGAVSLMVEGLFQEVGPWPSDAPLP